MSEAEKSATVEVARCRAITVVAGRDNRRGRNAAPIPGVMSGSTKGRGQNCLPFEAPVTSQTLFPSRCALAILGCCVDVGCD